MHQTSEEVTIGPYVHFIIGPIRLPIPVPGSDSRRYFDYLQTIPVFASLAKHAIKSPVPTTRSPSPTALSQQCVVILKRRNLSTAMWLQEKLNLEHLIKEHFPGLQGLRIEASVKVAKKTWNPTDLVFFLPLALVLDDTDLCTMLDPTELAKGSVWKVYIPRINYVPIKSSQASFITDVINMVLWWGLLVTLFLVRWQNIVFPGWACFRSPISPPPHVPVVIQCLVCHISPLFYRSYTSMSTQRPKIMTNSILCIAAFSTFSDLWDFFLQTMRGWRGLMLFYSALILLGSLRVGVNLGGRLCATVWNSVSTLTYAPAIESQIFYVGMSYLWLVIVALFVWRSWIGFIVRVRTLLPSATPSAHPRYIASVLACGVAVYCYYQYYGMIRSILVGTGIYILVSFNNTMWQQNMVEAYDITYEHYMYSPVHNLVAFILAPVTYGLCLSLFLLAFVWNYTIGYVRRVLTIE